MRFIDSEKGEHKPIDIFKYLLSGEYDQGDVALVSYDDLYDMVYDENRRQSIKESLINARVEGSHKKLLN